MKTIKITVPIVVFWGDSNKKKDILQKADEHLTGLMNLYFWYAMDNGCSLKWTLTFKRGGSAGTIDCMNSTHYVTATARFIKKSPHS